jgi:hypothetical protein
MSPIPPMLWFMSANRHLGNAACRALPAKQRTICCCNHALDCDDGTGPHSRDSQLSTVATLPEAARNENPFEPVGLHWHSHPLGSSKCLLWMAWLTPTTPSAPILPGSIRPPSSHKTFLAAFAAEPILPWHPLLRYQRPLSLS